MCGDTPDYLSPGQGARQGASKAPWNPLLNRHIKFYYVEIPDCGDYLKKVAISNLCAAAGRAGFTWG